MSRVALALLASVTLVGAAYALGGDTAASPVPKPDAAKVLTTGIINTGKIHEGLAKRYLVFEDGLHGFTTALAADGDIRRPGTHRLVEDFRVTLHGEGAVADASRIAELAGTGQAKSAHGLDGNGVRIAIVDTGVDFSNPDLRGSLARDSVTNHPIMLDADGQGLVLTNATFVAAIGNDGTIREYSGELPEWATSSVRVEPNGVYLDIERNGQGIELSVYNSFFPEAGPGDGPVFNATMSNDIRIGGGPRDYIESKSGVYRLGVIYQGTLEGPSAGLQVVPVLVVDSVDAGVYDTVIPDLSTSWMDYARNAQNGGADVEYDFDFTDEVAVKLGSGNETLVYDSDGDGAGDYSVGTLGAQVIDVYGVTGANYTGMLAGIEKTRLLPPLDPDGEFFGIMTDHAGHGTASAAAVASAGIAEYDIYNSTETFTIGGAAPGSEIVPIKALWYGNTHHAWMWASGLSPRDGGTWRYDGAPRADIVSNSWGIPLFPTTLEAPGTDALSMLISYLSGPGSLSPDYPGTLFVASAGNAGHGYGTLSAPGASPLAVTVGATTNSAFVGYGSFAGEPRFGNSTSPHGHLVDFSSRGPGTIADPKPDVVATGAYAFVPSGVTRGLQEEDAPHGAFSLFGGTSMSAPIVAGSAAVVMEAARSAGVGAEPSPDRIKSILLSTASDTGNDALSQGAGAVNATAAVGFVMGEPGSFVVTNDATHSNILEAMRRPFELVNATAMGLEGIGMPERVQTHTSWYGGRIAAGESSSTTFTVENPSDEVLEVSVATSSLALVSSASYEGATVPHQRDPDLDEESVFAPNYVRLDDIGAHDTLASYFERHAIPPESSLMVLSASFGLGEFMNMTANEDSYASDLQLASLYLYDWIDLDGDAKPESSELSLVSRAGSWGTVQEMRISDPASKFEGIPMVGVYPVPTRHSYWSGDTGRNATSIEYTLTASHYAPARWDSVWIDRESLLVPPHGEASVRATIHAQEDAPGVHQGFVRFEGDRQSTMVPVSYAVKVPPAGDAAGSSKGKYGELYSPGKARGAFDMVSTYMEGDWNQYHFDVDDESVGSALINVSWENPDTSVSVFVVSPGGLIASSSAPPGAFGQILGWPSSDWLGPTEFSQGGGFFPVTGRNETSTLVVAPVNGTGTYGIMTHTTVFGGKALAEDMSVDVRLR